MDQRVSSRVPDETKLVLDRVRDVLQVEKCQVWVGSVILENSEQKRSNQTKTCSDLIYFLYADHFGVPRVRIS